MIFVYDFVYLFYIPFSNAYFCVIIKLHKMKNVHFRNTHNILDFQRYLSKKKPFLTPMSDDYPDPRVEVINHLQIHLNYTESLK